MSIYKVANLFNKKLQKLASTNYLQLKELLNKAEELVQEAGKDVYDYINSSDSLDSIYGQTKKFMWQAYTQGVSSEQASSFKNSLKGSLAKLDQTLKTDAPSQLFDLNVGLLKNFVDRLDTTAIPAQKPAPAVTSPDAVEGIEDNKMQMSRVGPGVSTPGTEAEGIAYPQKSNEDQLSDVVKGLVKQDPQAPDYFGETWEK